MRVTAPRPTPRKTLASGGVPRGYFLLSEDELAQNGYPTDADVAERGFVDTRAWWEGGDAEEEHEAAAAAEEEAFPILAVDCEMCMSAKGQVLTRVSVVDEEDRVLLDELVRPAEPITDYLTQFSGITADMLAGVTTSLADVQDRLRALLTPRTALAGHSLECDLRALRLRHPRVLDTAVLFPHPAGHPRKSSLRFLARQLLRRAIQQGGAAGHDSVEDARATMALVRLKLRHGPDFGFAFGSKQTLALTAVCERAADRPGCIVASPFRLRGLLGARTCGVPADGDAETADRLLRHLARPPAGDGARGGGGARGAGTGAEAGADAGAGAGAGAGAAAADDDAPAPVPVPASAPASAPAPASGPSRRPLLVGELCSANTPPEALESLRAFRRALKRSAAEEEAAAAARGPAGTDTAPSSKRRRAAKARADEAAREKAERDARLGAMLNASAVASGAIERARRVVEAALGSGRAVVLVTQGPATAAKLLDRATIGRNMPWGRPGDAAAGKKGNPGRVTDEDAAAIFASYGEGCVVMQRLRDAATVGRVAVAVPCGEDDGGDA